MGRLCFRLRGSENAVIHLIGRGRGLMKGFSDFDRFAPVNEREIVDEGTVDKSAGSGMNSSSVRIASKRPNGVAVRLKIDRPGVSIGVSGRQRVRTQAIRNSRLADTSRGSRRVRVQRNEAVTAAFDLDAASIVAAVDIRQHYPAANGGMFALTVAVDGAVIDPTFKTVTLTMSGTGSSTG